MNQYLLLRDNKQTGPYTAEELAAKGLKAYDLVWLEGKSAAWRYPSEIAELKPFAPVVEEQPYDRFYKKPAQESHPFLDRARLATLKESRKEQISAPTAAEPLPVAQQPGFEERPAPKPEPAAASIHPQKIYVTLPASNGHFHDDAGMKETRNAPVSFSQNIVAAQEEHPVKEVPPLPDLYTQLQENERSRPRRKASSISPLMAVLAAACLLLFGVIIGLYISNMKQQNHNKSLEAQVQQILQRDRDRHNKRVVQEEQPPVQEMQQTAVDSSTQSANQSEEPEKKLAANTVTRKTHTPAETKQVVNTLPASKPELQPEDTKTQAEDDKEMVSYQQAAIESARKNIHQMLLVENSKYRTGVLGGISNLHMTLSNKSRFPLDQVEIEIRYFGPEQTLVKTQTLLFNDLAPGEQKTLEAPRTSRGVSIDYAITRINSKVLGLAQHTQF